MVPSGLKPMHKGGFSYLPASKRQFFKVPGQKTTGRRAGYRLVESGTRRP